MTATELTIIGLMVWTVMSFIWLYKVLAYDFENDVDYRWYDWLLSPPALLIVLLVGITTNLLFRYPKKSKRVDRKP